MGALDAFFQSEIAPFNFLDLSELRLSDSLPSSGEPELFVIVPPSANRQRAQDASNIPLALVDGTPNGPLISASQPPVDEVTNPISGSPTLSGVPQDATATIGVLVQPVASPCQARPVPQDQPSKAVRVSTALAAQTSGPAEPQFPSADSTPQKPSGFEQEEGEEGELLLPQSNGEREEAKVSADSERLLTGQRVRRQRKRRRREAKSAIVDPEKAKDALRVIDKAVEAAAAGFKVEESAHSKPGFIGSYPKANDFVLLEGDAAEQLNVLDRLGFALKRAVERYDLHLTRPTSTDLPP